MSDEPRRIYLQVTTQDFTLGATEDEAWGKRPSLVLTTGGESIKLASFSGRDKAALFTNALLSIAEGTRRRMM